MVYEIESHEVNDDPLDLPFTAGEVANICQRLPNGKAGGLDQIQYEHLTYGGKACCDILTVVLNSIREIESVPESLTTEITLSLFKGKKKSKLDKDSYRGITLLSVIGKFFQLQQKFFQWQLSIALEFQTKCSLHIKSRTVV